MQTEPTAKAECLAMCADVLSLSDREYKWYCRAEDAYMRRPDEFELQQEQLCEIIIFLYGSVDGRFHEVCFKWYESVPE